MPGATWFPQARLNYAENLLRHADGPLAERTAIVDLGEEGDCREISWRELGERVASLAAGLRRLGVGRGDRVAAVLPNVPEAIVGLLVSASIGATWCTCSPDLSVPAASARLGPLRPKVLVGSLGYRFGGRCSIVVRTSTRCSPTCRPSPTWSRWGRGRPGSRSTTWSRSPGERRADVQAPPDGYGALHESS